MAITPTTAAGSTKPTIVPVTTTTDDIEEEFPHIRENQYVLIHMPSGNVKMINLKPKSQVSLGKFGTFSSDNLIDKPFGLSYEIYDQKGNIRPVRNWALATVEETNANNQNILDNADVQKLTHEEVEKLKQEGLKGNMKHDEIINKIIESHSEFDKKTEFSKAKYIQRKRKKFMKVFTPVRPTLYSLAQFFFTKNPDKIKSMRVDTLSQIISLANVHANSKMLVVDDTQGLVVSAVAERMGGYGKIVGIHDGDHQNYDVMRYMNFSKRILESVHTIPLSKIDPNEPEEEFVPRSEEEVAAMSEGELRGYERRQKVAAAKAETRKLFFDGGFDGLIISSQYTPETVIKALVPYLSGSRRIVVYSHSKEVLLEAAHYMRKSTEYLAVDITESNLRQYQVLPGRTHPEMTTSAGGGYILSAIKIIDCPFDMSQVYSESNARRKKRRSEKQQKKKDEKALEDKEQTTEEKEKTLEEKPVEEVQKETDDKMDTKEDDVPTTA
ncbi:Gcd10p family-domain-containing protein [Phascolomyces articulosus]|uniref:tRNA (adenine(58)-N(1))-methyltransferase non-catalytic subunit TRM6 n=1 Tax=Phascolomyces articulosus TaxID=60185 RepID=A0AAD5P910_9FUNG|nr:Gcd10p family-domain-containing protein [Phascolomyces articulosus]